MSPDGRSQLRSGDDAFPSTQWSLVLAAGEDQSKAHEALDALCRRYWLPVYRYLRRRAASGGDAQDLTQAFFAHLIEKRSFEHADPQRGRFRSFLLTSAKNFVINEQHRAEAIKRGGDCRTFSLDFTGADAPSEIVACGSRTPEQQFEYDWAVALLEQVLLRLEGEFVGAGKAGHFSTLKRFLTGQNAGTTYADVAPSLGLSEQAARAAVSRLRRRYRHLLEQEIAQTVSSPEDVEDELYRLFHALES